MGDSLGQGVFVAMRMLMLHISSSVTSYSTLDTLTRPHVAELRARLTRSERLVHAPALGSRRSGCPRTRRRLEYLHTGAIRPLQQSALLCCTSIRDTLCATRWTRHWGNPHTAPPPLASQCHVDELQTRTPQRTLEARRTGPTTRRLIVEQPGPDLLRPPVFIPSLRCLAWRS